MFSFLKERFARLTQGAAGVLAMNQRNLLYVYPENPRHHFPLADNKLKTKEALAGEGVPMPKTHRVYGNFYELAHLADDLAALNDFVIKPAQGSGGGGIIAIASRTEHGWRSVSGRLYTIQDFRKHISDIIFGVHSFDLYDQAIIEERVVQHPEVERMSPLGLADVRLIMLRGRPALAMIRIPTHNSDGKANLHQGALGVGIDLENGRTNHAVWLGEPVSSHPDSGLALIDWQLPHWEEIKEIGCRAARALPLGYLGVDIAIGTQGPQLLEINVRPGLEIQNVNRQGLRRLLEEIGTSQESEESER